MEPNSAILNSCWPKRHFLLLTHVIYSANRTVTGRSQAFPQTFNVANTVVGPSWSDDDKRQTGTSIRTANDNRKLIFGKWKPGLPDMIHAAHQLEYVQYERWFDLQWRKGDPDDASCKQRDVCLQGGSSMHVDIQTVKNWVNTTTGGRGMGPLPSIQ